MNINRSSNYDRGTSDIKKRLDSFPSKRVDENFSSKRDSYKTSREEFKRDLDLPRHSNSSFGVGSARIDSNTKERFTDRSTSNFRSNASRGDDRDSRNGSSKQRYMDQSAETRFNDRQNVASSGAWNASASHQSFGLNTPGIWAEKQPDSSTSSAWRGLEDRYTERFASSDRKTLIPTQFIEPVRSSQFIASNPTVPGGRFGNNRYDNGRF